MKLWAVLPTNRWLDGEFWTTDDAGDATSAKTRCRGKADNGAAELHGNPTRDPERPWGDHPCGLYRVLSAAPVAPSTESTESTRRFGPAFLALEPVDGTALRAKRNGRTGLGIHGGALSADSNLRPTDGCLRLDNAVVAALAAQVHADLEAGRAVFYECRDTDRIEHEDEPSKNHPGHAHDQQPPLALDQGGE